MTRGVARGGREEEDDVVAGAETGLAVVVVAVVAALRAAVYEGRGSYSVAKGKRPWSVTAQTWTPMLFCLGILPRWLPILGSLADCFLVVGKIFLCSNGIWPRRWLLLARSDRSVDMADVYVGVLKGWLQERKKEKFSC